MKKIPLTQSKRYLSFIADRDKALEALLYRAKLEIDDVLRGTLTKVLESISYRYLSLGVSQFGASSPLFLKHIEVQIDLLFNGATSQIVEITKKLKRYSYTLSYVGQAEAIGQAVERPTKYDTRGKQKDNSKNVKGEDLTKRVHIALARIKRDIIDAFELSWVMEETPEQTLERINKTFPNSKRVKRPTKVLKQSALQEAEKKTKESISSGFVDPREWDALITWYKHRYIPGWRDPESPFAHVRDHDGDLMYAWELEQELTH